MIVSRQFSQINRFQSTFPRGERPATPSPAILVDNDFNPRSRVGNDLFSRCILNIAGNFNPRSRVGNDENGGGTGSDRTISIHVPAWGTTAKSNNAASDVADFNPRSRVGNDDFSIGSGSIKGISIHVPAWGTTPVSVSSMSSVVFQSTFPRGERPLPVLSAPPSSHFNPRSRVGNDAGSRRHDVRRNDFNPRSRVGNDPKRSGDLLSVLPFQSTFPRGERPFCSHTMYVYTYFNPRSRVGNDRIIFRKMLSNIDFNPRSRVGNDAAHSEVFICSCEISIHVPAWGTTANFNNFSLIYLYK